MAVKAFVLGRYQRLEKDRTDGIVRYGRTVFTKELSDDLPVGGIDFRSRRRLGIHDVVQRRRLAEKPEQIDRNGKHIKQKEDYKRKESGQKFPPPGFSPIQSDIPMPYSEKPFP